MGKRLAVSGVKLTDTSKRPPSRTHNDEVILSHIQVPDTLYYKTFSVARVASPFLLFSSLFFYACYPSNRNAMTAFILRLCTDMSRSMNG
jgi:hypothetical protein